jgi:hypothetical protein
MQICCVLKYGVFMQKNDTHLTVYSIVGWIFFLFPLVVMILWITSVYNGGNDIERAELFNSYFPEFMTSNRIIPVVSSVFSIISIVMCTMGLRAKPKGMTVINIFVIILAMLVFAMNIFSFI